MAAGRAGQLGGWVWAEGRARGLCQGKTPIFLLKFDKCFEQSPPGERVQPVDSGDDAHYIRIFLELCDSHFIVTCYCC